MRLLGIVGVLAAGLQLAACGDGDAGAIVGEQISWKLLGQGVHASHTQANVKQKFRVTCSRTAAGLNFVIEDPGFKGDPAGGVQNAMRPPGAIEVRNANLETGACNVTVKDAATFNDPLISYIGTCGASCSLTGQFGVEGWDFVGMLSCNALKINATGPAAALNYGVGNPNAGDGPVQISLANCD